MKVLFKILIACIALTFMSCEPEETVAPERNQLKISTTEEVVVLDENKPDEPVLTFTWNEAEEIGPDYSFTYILRLDIADNEFETAIDPVVMGDGVFSYSFKTAELYEYIVEKWHGVAGQITQIEARIVAKVNGPKFMYPEIATTKVSVQTYLPASQPLYLLGTATPAGLDPNQAIRMTEVSNGKIYTWKGELVQGNLKFITQFGSMLPSLNRGEEDSVLVQRNELTEPDDYFAINQPGLYYIYLSKKTMKISISRLKYQNIYIVGNATTAEWSIDNPIEMTPDAINPAVFTVQTTLKEGELKMPTAKSWDSPTFRPLQANGSILETEVQVSSAADGAADYKWKVTAAQVGTYKITLDTEKNKISFVKI